MATENGTGKVEQDLAYVRAVVDRQRQLICEAVPIWFAALVGLYLAGSSVLRDLADRGAVSPDAREWFGNIGLGVLLVLLFGLVRRKRRRDGRGYGPRLPSREKWHIILPWLAFIAAVLLFAALGSASGLDKAVLRPFFFAMTALAFTIIGLSSIYTVLGFGLGMAVGTIAFAFLNLAFPFSAFGICAGLGLVIGAYADQRRVRGA